MKIEFDDLVVGLAPVRPNLLRMDNSQEAAHLQGGEHNPLDYALQGKGHWEVCLTYPVFGSLSLSLSLTISVSKFIILSFYLYHSLSVSLSLFLFLSISPPSLPLSLYLSRSRLKINNVSTTVYVILYS